MSDLLTISTGIAPIITSFVDCYKVKKSTEIALAKIDSDLRIELEKIRSKGKNFENIIKAFSDNLNTVLANSNFSSSQKLDLFNSFLDKICDCYKET